MIGKTYWKSIVLPSILYGVNIMHFTKTEIKKLQQIENGVYRGILGAPKYAATCTLRGEIGSSDMRTRLTKGTLNYINVASTLATCTLLPVYPADPLLVLYNQGDGAKKHEGKLDTFIQHTRLCTPTLYNPDYTVI